MKRLFLLSLILLFTCAARADYYYYNNTSSNSGQNSGMLANSMYSKVGDTYYSGNIRKPTSYTQQGNKVYGSDGSLYTVYPDRTIQNNFTGKTYQIDNNTISPLY